MDVRWDSDGGPWSYWIDWADGPTVEEMRTLAAAVVGDRALSLDPASCRYHRTLSPTAWAVQLVRHLTADGHLGGGAWAQEAFRERLLRTPDVARAADETEVRLAEALVRLTAGEEVAMWELLAAHGLSALGKGPPPAGVTPLPRK